MNIPMTVEVFEKQNVLASFILHHPEHYTTGIVWRGEKCFYDGLNHCSWITLRPDHIDEKQGSYAYYSH